MAPAAKAPGRGFCCGRSTPQTKPWDNRKCHGSGGTRRGSASGTDAIERAAAIAGDRNWRTSRSSSTCQQTVLRGFGKGGQDDSWANRPHCRSCGGRQPTTSLAKSIAAHSAWVDGRVRRRGGMQTHGAATARPRCGHGAATAAGCRRQYGRRADGGAGGTEGGGAGARRGGGAAVGGSGEERE